jgi:hypothetical protein
MKKILHFCLFLLFVANFARGASPESLLEAYQTAIATATERANTGSITAEEQQSLKNAIKAAKRAIMDMTDDDSWKPSHNRQYNALEFNGERAIKWNVTSKAVADPAAKFMQEQAERKAMRGEIATADSDKQAKSAAAQAELNAKNRADELKELENSKAQEKLRVDIQNVNLAIRDGDLPKLKNIVQSGFSFKNMPDALFGAIYRQNVDVVSYLIENGVDVNFVNEKGISALSYLFWKGGFQSFETVMREDSKYLSTMEIMNRLISAGADVKYKSSDGHTASRLALYAGYLDFAEILDKL